MLPPPTWAAINRENGHAHLVWVLKCPVWENEENIKPARFLEAVREAFREKLGGDLSYTGLLTKNPLHPHWMFHCPTGLQLYDLSYLSEFVTLAKRPKRLACRVTAGEGWRNCGVFDALRHWAYSAVAGHENPLTFRSACIGQSVSLNAGLVVPMSDKEVLGIARSVSGWTWKHMGQGRGSGLAQFSKKQSARGKKGGRPRTTCANGKPWEMEGISRATWYRSRSRTS